MKFMFAVVLLCYSFSAAQENHRYININGTSEITIPADQITITVQIKTVNSRMEESKRINDEKYNELSVLLKNIGISNDDIQVSPLTLGKNYVYSERERKQDGYYAQLKVSFLLKDLSKYYELTNNLSTNDNYEIVNSDYNISDYELQHRSAFEQALKAAKEKADYMASTLGLKIGEVLEIEENSLIPNYPNPFNTATVINSQGDDISGKVVIRRSVRVKFALI
jgi:uncharacterized protein